MTRELKVGLFGALALVFFVFGFNFLKGRKVFSRQNEYTAEYLSIDGLLEKNSVMLNGLSVGMVENMEFKADNSGKIVVTFSIDNTLNIPNNTKALITSSDIMGNKVMELKLGDATTYLKDGDVLLGETQSNLTNVMREEIAPIKMKFEEIMGSVDSVLIIVRTIFNKNNLSNLDKSFNTIPMTLNNLNGTSTDIQALVKMQTTHIDQILANIENVTKNLKDNNLKINTILTNAETATDKLSKLEIQNTINQANESIAQLKLVVEKVNQGQGTLGMLLTDKALYNNLEKTSKDLDALMIDLKENPKNYVHFSVFNRKEKKPLPTGYK